MKEMEGQLAIKEMEGKVGMCVSVSVYIYNVRLYISSQLIPPRNSNNISAKQSSNLILRSCRSLWRLT